MQSSKIEVYWSDFNIQAKKRIYTQQLKSHEAIDREGLKNPAAETNTHTPKAGSKATCGS